MATVVARPGNLPPVDRGVPRSDVLVGWLSGIPSRVISKVISKAVLHHR